MAKKKRYRIGQRIQIVDSLQDQYGVIKYADVVSYTEAGKVNVDAYYPDGSTVLISVPTVQTKSVRGAPPVPGQGPNRTNTTASPKVKQQQATSGPSPKVNSGYTFPEGEAMKVAKDIKVAIEAGTLGNECEIGIRRLTQWVRVSEELHKNSVSNSVATACGFSLIALHSLPKESRSGISTIYQAHFGVNPDNSVDAAVKALGNRHKAMEKALGRVVHPMAALLDVVIGTGFSVWLWGTKGNGKSYAVRDVLEFQNREYYAPFLSDEAPIEELIGGTSLTHENGCTVSRYSDGLLTKSIREGKVFLWEEIAAASHAALHESMNPADRKPLQLPTGEQLAIPASWGLVATNNDAGLGDGLGYIGLKPVNVAVRDRFIFMELEAMPDDSLLKALRQSVEAARLWDVVGTDSASGSVAVAPKVTLSKKPMTVSLPSSAWVAGNQSAAFALVAELGASSPITKSILASLTNS